MLFTHLHGYQYFIGLHTKPSWEKFRKKAKISPGTYAEVFVKRMYSSVFEDSVDLLQEYNRYYKGEYKDFNQFLFWRHGVSEIIQNEVTRTKFYFLAIFRLDWRIDDEEILRNSFVDLFEQVDK